MLCYDEEDENIPEYHYIFQGDDTDSFGRHFIKVKTPKGLEDTVIRRVIFQCGKIHKEYLYPEFPFYIDLTREDTMMLSLKNKAYMLCEDEQGLSQTLMGSMIIWCHKKVVG